MSNLEGQTFEVECPFVVSVYEDVDEGGYYRRPTWKPGVLFEMADPYGDSANAIAHGMGAVKYTVVSVHQLPKPYPTRVFFTRKWVRPDGVEFGKSRLHVMTLPQFRRRLRGYVPAGVDQWTKLVVRPLTKSEMDKLVERAAA